MTVEEAKQIVLEVYPRFQIRKRYDPKGSKYGTFDGKNSKSKTISPWCESRNKAIIAAAKLVTAALPDAPVADSKGGGE